jgi:FKBP-type peptidyl-prolyl cis-trans isomerase FkpA
MLLERLRGICSLLLLVALSGCNGAEKDSESPVPLAPAITERRALEPGARDPDAPEEFSQTSSGLKYRILRASSGPRPTRSDRVTCHYRGWLDDGMEFDSSYKRGEPMTFALSGVVAGWTEGLQLVGEGGMIELEIPSELGYGPDGMPPQIPGGATLHFIVELIAIE